MDEFAFFFDSEQVADEPLQMDAAPKPRPLRVRRRRVLTRARRTRVHFIIRRATAPIRAQGP